MIAYIISIDFGDIFIVREIEAVAERRSTLPCPDFADVKFVKIVRGAVISDDVLVDHFIRQKPKAGLYCLGLLDHIDNFTHFHTDIYQ